MRATLHPSNLSRAASLLSAWLPQLAWGCPACAGRTPGEAPGGLYGLLGILLLPFVLAGLGISWARRQGAVGEARPDAQTPRGQEAPEALPG